MAYAFAGIPKCAVAFECGNPDEHFSPTAQLMFRLTTPPTCEMIAEGLSPVQLIVVCHVICVPQRKCVFRAQRGRRVDRTQV